MLTDFLLRHFLFIAGAPLQILGIIAGTALHSKGLPTIKFLLIASSLLNLLVFSFIVIAEWISTFTLYEFFSTWNEENTWFVLLGLWLIGMAGQMAAVLLVSLRFRKLHERAALLETLQKELKISPSNDSLSLPQR